MTAEVIYLDRFHERRMKVLEGLLDGELDGKAKFKVLTIGTEIVYETSIVRGGASIVCLDSDPIRSVRAHSYAERSRRMKPEIVRSRALSVQVCVPSDWTDEQVTAFANERPSGTSTGWIIRREAPERNPCADRPGCVHIALDC